MSAPRRPASRSCPAELPVDDLAPVSLAELVAEAELMTRVDRKYLVPARDAAAILSALGRGCRVLEIDGRRDFGYDSVYFDTADRLSYRLTAQKRRRRFKLRTRSYLDTGTAFLELKTKSGRGSTVKDRLAYEPADRARITRAGGAYLGALLSGHGHDPALVAELRPELVSRYRRTTLLLPGGSRATIDTRLRWSSVPDPGLAVGLTRYVIIESKSAGAPSELDRALWRAGHRPHGISKFGTGMAALHPELPGNTWARVLRGPFAEGRPGLPMTSPQAAPARSSAAPAIDSASMPWRR